MYTDTHTHARTHAHTCTHAHTRIHAHAVARAHDNGQSPDAKSNFARLIHDTLSMEELLSFA